MNKKELEKLQRYIYKRPQNQSDQDVINHIVKANLKLSLCQGEWNKLLIPACSGMAPKVFHWLIDNGAVIADNSIDLAKMIIGSQENRLEYLKKRIRLLEILLMYTKEQYLSDTLGYALLNACWFNNLYVVPFLVDKGANIYFESSNQKTPFECAKNYGERFMDYTLYHYLNDYIDTGEWNCPEAFYTGTDLMGNSTYQIIS